MTRLEDIEKAVEPINEAGRREEMCG